MNKPDLTTVLDDLLTAKQESEQTLYDVEPHLRPGRETLKNQALHRAQDLYATLRTILPASTGGIVVSGPGGLKFSEIAENEGPALTLDVSEMYKRIAEVWFPTVRVDRRFALDCLPAFLEGVAKLLPSMGVRTIANPDFKDIFGRPVETFEEAVTLTREVMRATVGDDLNVLYLVNRLTEKVVEAEWDLAFVPVVLLNASREEVDGALFDQMFTNVHVTAPENVEKNDVLAAFKSLRAKRVQQPGEPKRRGRPPGSKNKPKDPPPGHTDLMVPPESVGDLPDTSPNATNDTTNTTE